MAKFGTGLFFAIFLLVGLSAGRVAQIRVFVVVFLTVLAIATYAFAPRRYVIDNEGIKIKRLAGKVIIPYTDIVALSQLTLNDQLDHMIVNNPFPILGSI